jgi:hypothetical protein
MHIRVMPVKIRGIETRHSGSINPTGDLSGI